MSIVIVTHDYPPSRSAGAMRPAWLARGLAARGHDVLVLTAQTSPETEVGGPKVITIPYTSARLVARRAVGIGSESNLASVAAKHSRAAETFVRFAARTVESLSLHPDNQRGWIPAGQRWIRTNVSRVSGADVVIASSPPVSSAFLGRHVASAAGVPLILDLRDLWTDNLYYPHGPLRHAVDVAAENRLLKAASGLSVTTQRLAEKIAPRVQAPVAIVRTSPPVPMSVRPAPAFRPGEPFRLGFFGSTYEGRRDLRPMLRALKSLRAEHGDSLCNARLDAWGNIDARALSFVAEDSELTQLVHFPGSLSKRETDERLLDVHLALCPMWPDDTDALPLKVLEYLASGREILVTDAHADSEIRRTLENAPGVRFVDGDSAIEGALFDACRRWQAGDTLFHLAERRAAWMSHDAFLDGFLGLVAQVRAARKGIGETS